MVEFAEVNEHHEKEEEEGEHHEHHTRTMPALEVSGGNYTYAMMVDGCLHI